MVRVYLLLFGRYTFCGHTGTALTYNYPKSRYFPKKGEENPVVAIL
jgi:hypothetical protein